jgi:hypothetical protein
MALRKICVNEVTTINMSQNQNATSSSLQGTPVAVAPTCQTCIYNQNWNWGTTPPSITFSYDANIGYKYISVGGETFTDLAPAQGLTGSIILPTGSSTCLCGGGPTFTTAISCFPASITYTATDVSISLVVGASVDGFCAPTFMCVDVTTTSC